MVQLSMLQSNLSMSEKRVLKHYVGGKTAVEIANDFGRSTRTIENQIASIYRKLNINGKVELIRWADKNGFKAAD